MSCHGAISVPPHNYFHFVNLVFNGLRCKMFQNVWLFFSSLSCLTSKQIVTLFQNNISYLPLGGKFHFYKTCKISKLNRCICLLSFWPKISFELKSLNYLFRLQNFERVLRRVSIYRVSLNDLLSRYIESKIWKLPTLFS